MLQVLAKKMAMPASTIYTFAYFMNGKEQVIELRSDMSNIRFRGRKTVGSPIGDPTPPHGRYECINQTLFGWFHYKGPGFRAKLFSVTLIAEMDGTWALEGRDEEQRHIIMRPLTVQRGELLVHNGREIINALFGFHDFASNL